MSMSGNLDHRLMYRVAVRRLLAGLREGKVAHGSLSVSLDRLRARGGSVVIDTLLQEMASTDHTDRHMAVMCLQVMGDPEIEDRCLEVIGSPRSEAQTKVSAIEVLESLGYEQDDLLPRIPHNHRPAIAEAMLEGYITLISDPDSLGGMLRQFLDLDSPDQHSYLQFFEASQDPRVVDFLWHVVQTAGQETAVRASQALAALAAAGVRVGGGPRHSLVSLLERETGETLEDDNLLHWGFRCVQEGDLLMAEACLWEYLCLDPGHGAAFLQLAVILATQGRTEECLDLIEEASDYLPDHQPHMRKGWELAGLLKGWREDRWEDPVERALEAILGGLLPSTPHGFQLGMLMWNLFLRFNRQPLDRIRKPVGWAAAVVYNLRRIMGMPMSGEDLARRVEDLGSVSASTLLRRARQIRQDLELDWEYGVEWLYEELAHRLEDQGHAEDPAGFPDWSLMSAEEARDLDDFYLWMTSYRCPPGAIDGFLDDHPSVESMHRGDRWGRGRSYEWKGFPLASPYTLGRETKATFLVDDQWLTVVTLSYRDMKEARQLVESGLGARAILAYTGGQPLFEIAPESMISAASRMREGTDLRIDLRMDMVPGETEDR